MKSVCNYQLPPQATRKAGPKSASPSRPQVGPQPEVSLDRFQPKISQVFLLILAPYFSLCHAVEPPQALVGSELWTHLRSPRPSKPCQICPTPDCHMQLPKTLSHCRAILSLSNALGSSDNKTWSWRGEGRRKSGMALGPV